MKKLAILIPCSWANVPREFFQSFLNMTRFEVQKQLLEKHGVEMKFLIHDAFPLDRCRSEMMELAIERYQADFLLWIDADMTYDKDTVLTLFESLTDEFPICCVPYFKKASPHTCVAGWYTQNATVSRETMPILEKNELVDAKDGQQCLFYRNATNFTGEKPFQIDVSGFGGVMMRSDAIKGLKRPLFKYFDRHLIEGWNIDGTTEEMLFWARCRQAGIGVRLHPKVQAGHLRESEVALLGDYASCV